MLGAGDTTCDPGRWDKRQVAIWMESHSVSHVSTHAYIMILCLPCAGCMSRLSESCDQSQQYFYLITNGS